MSGRTELWADPYGVILPIWYNDDVDCRDGRYRDGDRKFFCEDGNGDGDEIMGIGWDGENPQGRGGDEKNFSGMGREGDNLFHHVTV